MTSLPITQPGIYNLTAKQYHANPCDGFAISRSFLADIISKSPQHAKFNSSELTPSDDEEVDSKAMRIGTAMHELALGNAGAVVVIQADNFRTKDARALRDEAIAAGHTPMLPHEMAEVSKAVAVLGNTFQFGTFEQTYIWQRNGIWCRAMLDHITTDGYIQDYKTTSGSAEPASWVRNHLYPDLLDMQAAWYIEAYELLTGNTCKGFRFIVQEQKAPYAVSVINCDLETIRLGQARIEKAFAIACECLASDSWPSYGAVWATPPAYVVADWEMKNAN